MSTTTDYEFTAFSENDFGAGNIGYGSCFTMPALATTCITVTDDDGYLSGDSRNNENATDCSYQTASISIDGEEAGNSGQIYAEKYNIVRDQDGNKYIMIEIEQEGSNDDYFSFFEGYGYAGTPPAGSELTVICCGNVCGNWIDYNCLDAGPKDVPTGSIAGTVFCDLDCDGIQDSATTEYTYGSNLIVNGGFEDNALNNSGSSLGVASGLTGWFDIGSAPAQIHEQNYGHGNATGDAIVELECGVIICQEVNVVEEGCYLLSFDVTRRGTSDQDNTFTLFIDGVQYEQYTVSSAGTINIELDLSVGDHRFDFKSDSNTYLGAGLDDVALRLKTVDEVNVEEPGKEGITVNLVDAFGTIVGTTTTDADGNYKFDEIPDGDYTIQVVAPDGQEFTGQNVGPDDSIDSDVNAAGVSGVITLSGGNDVTDVDAGLKEVEVVNEAPTPMDDAEDTCYADAVSIDVTANDTDPENDALTITAINGIAIAEGDPAIDIDGVQVTLVGGELVFDGSAVHAGLLTGEEAVSTYSYTVSDGNGNEASANVEVTFCGATDTLDKVKDSIPASVQFQITNDNDPEPSATTEAWTMQVTDGSGTLSGTFTAAYCLSAFDNVLSGQFGSDINTAALIDANVYVADDDYVPAGTSFGFGGANGESGVDNLDMINWIINQGFTSQDNGDGTASNYTDNEIQNAIWLLTDGFTFLDNDGVSTEANIQEIYDAAIANGEGFEANAANGDIVTVYFDPTGDNDPSNDHVQPFIAAIDLFEDCIC